MVVATIKYAKPSTPVSHAMCDMLIFPPLQVRRRRRRCGRKDMSSYQLYHEQVSLGICPHRIRQLRRDRHVSFPLLLSRSYILQGGLRWVDMSLDGYWRSSC